MATIKDDAKILEILTSLSKQRGLGMPQEPRIRALQVRRGVDKAEVGAGRKAGEGERAAGRSRAGGRKDPSAPTSAAPRR